MHLLVFAMTAQHFYRRVLLEAGRPGLADAKRVKLLWWEGEMDGRRPVKLHKKEFYDRVRGEAGLASEREARQVTQAVFGALKQQLSPGESDDVLTQLPKDL